MRQASTGCDVQHNFAHDISCQSGSIFLHLEDLLRLRLFNHHVAEHNSRIHNVWQECHQVPTRESWVEHGSQSLPFQSFQSHHIVMAEQDG